MAANVFRFEDTWNIPGVSAEAVYDVLSRGELLPLWWKGVYLEAERLSGGGKPEVGDRLRARARGFLPYEMSFILESVALEPRRRVEVKAAGDLDGRWTASLSETSGGARVDLVWEVTVLRPLLRALAPLVRPVFAWNHRWTTARGEEGLRAFLAHGQSPEAFACGK